MELDAVATNNQCLLGSPPWPAFCGIVLSQVSRFTGEVHFSSSRQQVFRQRVVGLHQVRGPDAVGNPAAVVARLRAGVTGKWGMEMFNTTGSSLKKGFDFDSGGWPRSGRQRALMPFKDGHTVMLHGDQHFGVFLRHGVNDWNDEPYVFMVLGTANGFPLAFWPKAIKSPEIYPTRSAINSQYSPS